MIKLFRYFIIILITLITCFVIVYPVYAPLSLLSLFGFLSERELLNLFYKIFIFGSLLVLVLNGLDLIFGFTTRRYLKNKVDLSAIENYEEIKRIYEKLKSKFKSLSSKLVIVNSSEINAYAIVGLGRKYLVLTTGLLSHLRSYYSDKELYLKALEGIMAHEFSHLINNDSIPAIIHNGLFKILSITEVLLKAVFDFLKIPFYAIPIVNIVGLALDLIYQIYKLIFEIIYKFIITPLFELTDKFISRKIEYRCDKEAAFATGDCIYYGLSALPNNGYNSIFSTHPSIKNRIEKIKGIKPKKIKFKLISFDYFLILLVSLYGVVVILLILSNFYKNSLPKLYTTIINLISWFYGKYFILHDVISSFIIKKIYFIFNFFKEDSLINAYYSYDVKIFNFITILLIIFLIYIILNLIIYLIKRILYSNKENFKT